MLTRLAQPFGRVTEDPGEGVWQGEAQHRRVHQVPPMRHAASLAAILIAAVACSGPTEPFPRPTVVASVSRAEVKVGETVTVDVTVTNETSRPIKVPDFPTAFLEVRDAAGRLVAFGRFEIVALIARPPLRLEPGETVTDRVPWAGELTGANTRAAAGTYQIRAAVPVLGVRANAFVYSYSAPVSVVLTSP